MDKAIEQQFEIIPNTLTSIPGIGKVYSAGIIAEIGDIHRFDSQASVAKFAGLVWTQHQSGEFEAEHSRMIKSGNRYLRYYLLEAANSVRRCDSEFRRYYDLKYHEVNKYQHKRALALNCQKTGSVGLSAAEGQPPVYPAGGLSEPLAALTTSALFQKLRGQGLGLVLPFCCLHGPFLAHSHSKFSCITPYLTSYHWTFFCPSRRRKGMAGNKKSPCPCKNRDKSC